MFIRTNNEIKSLMPTARWSRPEQLLGYLEEEEQGTFIPLLGMPLYLHLCKEYERLREEYVDITAATVKPTRKAKEDPGLAYADVTERMEAVQQGSLPCCECMPIPDDYFDVPGKDMKTISLLRICQRVEFYKMLSHKAGLLNVSFNEGGGMNTVSADGYDPAEEKRIERAVKDAFMSAGRATDDLLLFLEADAKGERLFTELWSEADAFYLHKDLLFQTARVLNEYLDIKGERMAYVQLVRDVRFCQNTYLKPRIGGKLLKAVVAWSNGDDLAYREDTAGRDGIFDELLSLLRTALAFYVEGRRMEIGPKGDRLARRDSMTDAQQAMAMACQFVEDNLDALGEAAADSPAYKAARAREVQAARDAENAEAAQRRRCCQQRQQSSRKLFTGFPVTHRIPETKN